MYAYVCMYMYIYVDRYVGVYIFFLKKNAMVADKNTLVKLFIKIPPHMKTKCL